MRFFELLSFQHVVAALLPALVFMFLFFAGLGYFYIRTRDSEERETAVSHHYPDGLGARDAPFPLFMTLILIGAFLWAFFYILFHGISGISL